MLCYAIKHVIFAVELLHIFHINNFGSWTDPDETNFLAQDWVNPEREKWETEGRESIPEEKSRRVVVAGNELETHEDPCTDAAAQDPTDNPVHKFRMDPVQTIHVH